MYKLMYVYSEETKVLASLEEIVDFAASLTFANCDDVLIKYSTEEIDPERGCFSVYVVNSDDSHFYFGSFVAVD